MQRCNHTRQVTKSSTFLLFLSQSKSVLLSCTTDAASPSPCVVQRREDEPNDEGGGKKPSSVRQPLVFQVIIPTEAASHGISITWATLYGASLLIEESDDPAAPRATQIHFFLQVVDSLCALALMSEESCGLILTFAGTFPSSMQSLVDEWLPKVRNIDPAFGMRLKKRFVLAVPDGVGGYQRVEGDRVYTDTMEAVPRARAYDEQNKLGRCRYGAKSCRVIEESYFAAAAAAADNAIQKEDSRRIPRTADDLIGLLGEANWKDHVASHNGYLSLRDQGLGASDVDAIVEVCRRSQGVVTQLGLTGNCLRCFGAAKLVDFMLQEGSAGQCITGLFLSSNEFGNQGTCHIARLLSSGSLSVVKIGLNNNSIDDAGAVVLANSILERGPLLLLEVLGLSDNEIGFEGALAFATALRHNRSLQRIFFNTNPKLGDDGVRVLVESLENNMTLLRLGVAGCNGAEASGAALVRIVPNHPTLERVCVHGSRFTLEDECALKACPRMNFLKV